MPSLTFLGLILLVSHLFQFSFKMYPLQTGRYRSNASRSSRSTVARPGGRPAGPPFAGHPVGPPFAGPPAGPTAAPPFAGCPAGRPISRPARLPSGLGLPVGGISKRQQKALADPEDRCGSRQCRMLIHPSLGNVSCNQWRKSVGLRRCKACVSQRMDQHPVTVSVGLQDSVSDLSSSVLYGVTDNMPGDFAPGAADHMPGDFAPGAADRRRMPGDFAPGAADHMPGDFAPGAADRRRNDIDHCRPIEPFWSNVIQHVMKRRARGTKYDSDEDAKDAEKMPHEFDYSSPEEDLDSKSESEDKADYETPPCKKRRSEY